MKIISILENAVRIKSECGAILQVPFIQLHPEHELLKSLSRQALHQLSYWLGFKHCPCLRSGKDVGNIIKLKA